MKTKNVVLGVCILLFASTLVVANDGEAYKFAKNNLNLQLEEVANQVPFADLYDEYASNELEVSFVINPQGEISNLEVTGENKDLASWTKVAISKKQIKVNPLLIGHNYKVKLSFKDGSKPIY